VLHEAEKITVKAGRSRYVLTGLNPSEYPQFDEGPGAIEFSLSPVVLRELLQQTSFSMAQQDVRYYLNGLLFWISGDNIRAVATDGHRLATHEVAVKVMQDTQQQVIIPRKAVLELSRLLAEETEELGMVLGDHHLRVITPRYSFSAKLIEGKFPDYRQVLPKAQGFEAIVNKEKLKEMLQRISVLFSDKYRGICVAFSPNTMQVTAKNQEQEEAEEAAEIEYDGPERRIGFNCSYLLEYLSIIKSPMLKIRFSDPNASVLLEPLSEEEGGLYVVMPMRL
jgi:DNA polymerase-3 subunit beta